jgi:tRNA(adenine34) deaminase
MIDNDERYMRIAIEQALIAREENEIPIGAVLVNKENEVVAKDHNRTRQLQNPMAHAEHLILDDIHNAGVKYLYDYTLFVTIEPCCMCAGMLIWSRIGRIVFGSYDEKAGAVGSIYNIPRNKNFNHHPEIRSGVLESECGDILKQFFQNKR